MNADDDKTQSTTVISAGMSFSHYRVIEKIGAGGMGDVFLAEDTELNRKVALKFLPVHLCQDAECRARFKREAHAAAKLNHPNIVTIYEVSEFKGRPFFAMEHLEGRSLRDLIAQKDLSLSRAIDMAVQLCEGLQEAHSRGIIHRDIKPSNIACDRKGRCKILDFGLATIRGADKLTRSGSTLGTLHYMSPEQTRGEAADERSDIFSLGVVLYEMITGQLPFKGDHDPAVVYAIGYEEPEPLARYKSGISDELQRIISKTLAKDKGHRYQHIDDLLSDLRALTVTPRKKISPLAVMLFVSLGAAIVIGGAFSTRFFSNKSQKSTGPKKLVVLPLENVGSPDEEYFASGMTDEIMSRLTNINGLAVISRASASRLKEMKKSIQEIGKELGADYVLDGTIRWQEGSDGRRRLRLVTQLIKVKDDINLWSKTYDTVMTEVFSVQSEIAENVADQMGVFLSPAEKKQVWEAWTDSEQAYDFYLRGWRETWRYGGYGARPLRLGLELQQKAVTIDSNFALAYNQISLIYSRLYFFGFDRSDSIRNLARTTAEKAHRLSDNAWIGNFALGEYSYRCLKDYGRALEYYDSAFAKINKENNAGYLNATHHVLRRMGRWEDAYHSMKKVIDLDPKTEVHMYDLATDCEYMRRYPEAESLLREVIALKPDFSNAYSRLADMYLRWQGDPGKVREVMKMSVGKVDSAIWVGTACFMDQLEGNYDAALLRLTVPPFDSATFFAARAQIYRFMGRDSLMRSDCEAALALMKYNVGRVPGYDSTSYGYLGTVADFNSRLGNRVEALAANKKVLESWSLAKDAMLGADAFIVPLNVYAALGDLDRALETLEEALSVPGTVYFGQLLVDPDFARLVRHLGFKKLTDRYGDEIVKQKYLAMHLSQ